MTDPRSILQERFGLADFRPGQEAVIRDVLAGRDVLAVLPTGAGKSLCYQLPALLLEGITLVCSPLVALMQDQVAGMRRRGLPATCLHSGLDADETARARAAVAEGSVRIVLVAPERLGSPAFMESLRGRRIALFAVDEAHCVSEWGHDFRPAYRRLGAAARALAVRSVLALTATATPEVRRDVADGLGMRSPVVHVAGFFRPNLRVAVRPVAEAERLPALAEALPEAPARAIAYAGTRWAAEEAATWLRARGLRFACYHAGMKSRERARVQEAFRRGAICGVVATNAFGLGVDVPDVRAVVHLHLPGSLEAYYQEIGRGGRDGESCRCTLLFAEEDVALRRRLLEVAHPHPSLAAHLVRQAARGRLNAFRLADTPGCTRSRAPEYRRALAGLLRLGMLRAHEFGHVAVADSGVDLEALHRRGVRQGQLLRRMADFARRKRGCRHVAVLRYFGERVAWRSCGACDVCDLGSGTHLGAITAPALPEAMLTAF